MKSRLLVSWDQPALIRASYIFVTMAKRMAIALLMVSGPTCRNCSVENLIVYELDIVLQLPHCSRDDLEYACGFALAQVLPTFDSSQNYIATHIDNILAHDGPARGISTPASSLLCFRTLTFAKNSSSSPLPHTGNMASLSCQA